MTAYSLAQVRILEAFDDVEDDELTQRLLFAEEVIKRVCGIEFGAIVTAVEDLGSDVWRLTTGLSPDDLESVLMVSALGVAGVETLDVVASGDGTIDVSSAAEVAVGRVLPVRTFAGRPRLGRFVVFPRPINSVVSVTVNSHPNTDWDENGDLLETDAYRLLKHQGLNLGLKIDEASVPRLARRKHGMLNHTYSVPEDCVRAVYVCGFTRPPLDLLKAITEVAGNADSSSELQSENLDGYSWSRGSPELLASLPYSVAAILKRYQTWR